MAVVARAAVPTTMPPAAGMRARSVLLVKNSIGAEPAAEIRDSPPVPLVYMYPPSFVNGAGAPEAEAMPFSTRLRRNRGKLARWTGETSVIPATPDGPRRFASLPGPLFMGEAGRKLTGSPFYGAVAIHDRYETPEQYRALSA